MKSVLKMASAALLTLAAALPAAAQLPYMDKNLSPEQRAEDLLGRLTLVEKASLMDYNSQAIPRLGIPAYNWWNEALHESPVTATPQCTRCRSVWRLLSIPSL